MWHCTPSGDCQLSFCLCHSSWQYHSSLLPFCWCNQSPFLCCCLSSQNFYCRKSLEELTVCRLTSSKWNNHFTSWSSSTAPVSSCQTGCVYWFYCKSPTRHTSKVYLFKIHTTQGTNCDIIANLFIDTPLKILIRESEQSQWCGWHHCWPQHQLLSLWHYPHSLLKISETNSVTAWKSQINQWYSLWVSCRCFAACRRPLHGHATVWDNLSV